MNNALTGSVSVNTPLSQHSKPVGRAARILMQTANAEDVDHINQQLIFLPYNANGPKSLSSSRFKAASETTANAYQTQESTLLSIPMEIRAKIFKFAFEVENEDNPQNLSFTRLPKLVLACKQLLTEVPPIFYQVNTFNFAVGSNWYNSYNDSNSRAHCWGWDGKNTGVLCMKSQRRKASLAEVSETRLCDVNFKIYDPVLIQGVRTAIPDSRRGLTRELKEANCQARLTVVDGRLILKMGKVHRHRRWYSSTSERKLSVTGKALIQTAIQAVVYELNQRGDTKRGLSVGDVMRLAATLKFEGRRTQK